MTRRRTSPGWALRLVLAGLLGLAAWIHLGDWFGDYGLQNVFSGIVLLLAALLLLGWFVVFSAFSRRARLLVLAGVVGLALIASLSVRIDGFRGAMRPELSWAWSARGFTPEAPEASTSDYVVDLALTSDADYPGFLGTHGAAPVDLVLETDWEANPPVELWRQRCGAGWSAFAAVNGVAVTMEEWGSGTQESPLRTAVIALRLEDGARLWSHSWEGGFAHEQAGDGPRSTPLIHMGNVYAVGSWGRFVALDGADGELLWEHDLLSEWGVDRELETRTIGYGRSCSPVALDDMVLLPVGGNPEVRQSGLVAFDALTGEVRWEGPGRKISHSTPSVATLCGVRQVLVVNEATVSGHDPASGELWWEHDWPASTPQDPNASQAVPLPGDRVWVSKGYGAGSMVLQISRTDAGAWQAQHVWISRRSIRTKFTNIVTRDGHAYGLSDGMLECVKLSDGKRVWKEGRYSHGQTLGVGEHLLVQAEDGYLVLIEAKPGGEGAVLARLDALDDKTWTTPALFGDVLLQRNAVEAVAYRLPLAR